MLKTIVIVATMTALGLYLLVASTKGKDETVWFREQELKRRSIVHLPPGVGEGKLPAVFVFHGLFGNSDYTKNTYGITEIADSEGFIAVYPEGTGVLNTLLLSWNAGFCCGYARENSIDDVQYIVELLEFLKAKYPIDEKRVYLVGLSNGGMLTYELVSKHPELFAGAAIVSSTPAGGQSEENITRIQPPAEPVPMIIFHGKLDSVIPYAGGYAGDSQENTLYFPSVAESVALWAAGMGADTLHESELEEGKVLLRKYTGSKKNSEILFYTILDGDHTWPGREKGLDALQSSSNSSIKASELIWEFFEKIGYK